MRLDLYQAETARIATQQSALLTLAKQRFVDGLTLSPLEQSGVLHALQILIENAIGKAKQFLKAQDEPRTRAGFGIRCLRGVSAARVTLSAAAG